MGGQGGPDARSHLGGGEVQQGVVGAGIGLDRLNGKEVSASLLLDGAGDELHVAHHLAVLYHTAGVGYGVHAVCLGDGEVGHQNIDFSIGGWLRTGGFLAGVVHQNSGDLSAGSIALGIEHISALAVHNAVGPDPVHGVHGIGGDGVLIGKIGAPVRCRTSRIAPKDSSDLLAGDRIAGSEQAAAVAADHALLGGPQNGVGIPGALHGIGKGVAAGHSGAARQPVQHRGQHGAGHGVIGGEGGGADAAHQAVVPDILRRLRVPGVCRHVGKAGVADCGKGGRTEGAQHGGCQEPS